MIKTMAPIYWIVALLTIILGYYAEKNPISVVSGNGIVISRPNKRAAFFLAMILIFISGFRYGVGTDFFAYYSESYTWADFWERLTSLKEPGLAFVSVIGNLVVKSPQTDIFVCSLVTITLFSTTIYKNCQHFFLSSLMYLFLGDWHGSFNGVRQFLAAAILFAGYRYIIERNWKKYFLIVFIAFLFHQSALVMIIPYFLFTRKMTFRHALFLAIGAIIIRGSYQLVFDIISDFKGTEMVMESEAYYNRSVSILRVLVTAAPALMYLLLCRKVDQNREEVFSVNAVVFNMFCMLACMGSAYLARISTYTNMYLIVAYGHLLDLIEEGKTKKIITILILILFFAYWYYSIVLNNNLRVFTWAFDHL